jgi:hypothetical protein
MIGSVIKEMIRFFGKDRRRIGHALKVYGYAKAIGELENLDDETREITETAAVLHDVGIKIAEEKYGSCSPRQQEEEGPPAARRILEGLHAGGSLIDRVCWLIAHHHSPGAGEDRDFRILLEADFLVNLEEGDYPPASAPSIGEKHFRTPAGLAFLEAMY